MGREILVQTADCETRVAVLEEGRLAEIYVERGSNDRLVGDIYKGIVRNVLPGMQAAFIDIGMEKNAFLFVEDALACSNWQEENNVEQLRDGVHPSIRDVVKEGQEIVVQITKEAAGTKGARVTTHLTIPGRYLVLVPAVDYIGVSRRINDEKERERLKAAAWQIKPENMGIIVRTAAEGAAVEELKQDIEGLMKIWQAIKLKAKRVSAPALIHKDLELVQRILRDVFSDDVKKIRVNSREVMDRVIEFLEVMGVDLKGKVFLSDTADLFAKYAVDHEIAQALRRKVWLKSGGYLVIDETEALTVIDVNTGKYTGSTDLADTVFRTNSEAAREIARQLRLRNIGGIIVIDFIDMQNSAHREEIISILEEELKKDKMKAHVLGITPLGLVEMTRKKARLSLSSIFEKTCPCCEGKGRVVSEETISLTLRKELREKAAVTSAGTLEVTAHPLVTALLTGPNGDRQRELERELGKSLVIKAKEQFMLEKYEIRAVQDLIEFDTC
ncbi:MAG: Rne/Rng family ribonuclease [Peptococcaceae bacterium]|nr:Rne/Rng family ribonuclease [Peptococcaceae bacterium]MDH7525536.1 Rne/Rng family ribonuclease [Peptococcaceae bacterium]